MQKNLYQKSIRLLRSQQLHFICWSVFIFYEIVVSGLLTGHFSPVLDYVLFYFLNISLFYIHSLYILPYAMVNTIDRIWRLPLAFILELIVYVMLAMAAEMLISFHMAIGALVTSRFIVATIWRGVYFIMYGTGFYFLRSYLSNQQQIHEEAIQIEKLNNQLLRAEKDFLRAQINPHLLFNTLNFIKYAAKKKPESVEEAVLTLSQIIGFSLDKNNTDFLTLSSELTQVSNLIRLNQLRYENRLFLKYRTEIADDNIFVIPIVLLTLVENVFKHGNLSLESDPATINISTTETHLYFYSSNLPINGVPFNAKSDGFGLKNIASRLQSYYPEKHSFFYGLRGAMYVVNLSITI